MICGFGELLGRVGDDIGHGELLERVRAGTAVDLSSKTKGQGAKRKGKEEGEKRERDHPGTTKFGISFISTSYWPKGMFEVSCRFDYA